MVNLYTIVNTTDKEPARKVMFLGDIPLLFEEREAKKFCGANFSNEYKVARISTIVALRYYIIDPIIQKLYK